MTIKPCGVGGAGNRIGISEIKGKFTILRLLDKPFSYKPHFYK